MSERLWIGHSAQVARAVSPIATQGLYSRESLLQSMHPLVRRNLLDNSGIQEL